MFENKKQKLAAPAVYYHRIRKSILLSLAILITFLCAGGAGYKLTIPEFDWYDSFLNAGTIQTNMIIAAALIEGLAFFAVYVAYVQNPFA